MNIKKILVAVDGSAVSLARLETGVNLALSLGASVSALYVMSIRVPAVYSGGLHGGWYMGDELLARSRSEAMQAASEVHESCSRVVSGKDIKLDWIQIEGDLVSVTNAEAKYHDLLLLGRPDTVNEPQVVSSELNSILLGCGKPCLVVPGATPLMVLAPRNIVFGWDGSREACQAMINAMSFFDDAESVMVVSAHKNKQELEMVTESNRRITALLVDHGINATGHILDQKGKSTSRVLSDYAHDTESDMIVIGAYGHSRFRETVLGGATRDMLNEASLPVLYAH